MHKVVFTATIFGLLCSLFVTMLASGSEVDLTVAMWIAAGPEVDRTQEILDTYMAENKSQPRAYLPEFSGYHEKMLTPGCRRSYPDVMVPVPHLPPHLCRKRDHSTDRPVARP